MRPRETGDEAQLIEDYLPIQAISAEAPREKNIRKGHIPVLHLEWAKGASKTGEKDKAFALDVTRIHAPEGKLTVTISPAAGGHPEARIRTYCRCGKHVAERDAGYFLDGP